MDDILRRVFPTRRVARFGPQRSASEDAAWAESLDWQTNEHAFHGLFQCLVQRLDSGYGERGFRWDQLSNRKELLASAQRAAAWYGQATPQYRREASTGICIGSLTKSWTGGLVGLGNLPVTASTPERL